MRDGTASAVLSSPQPYNNRQTYGAYYTHTMHTAQGNCIRIRTIKAHAIHKFIYSRTCTIVRYTRCAKQTRFTYYYYYYCIQCFSFGGEHSMRRQGDDSGGNCNTDQSSPANQPVAVYGSDTATTAIAFIVPCLNLCAALSYIGTRLDCLFSGVAAVASNVWSIHLYLQCSACRLDAGAYAPSNFKTLL